MKSKFANKSMTYDDNEAKTTYARLVEKFTIL